MTPQGTGSMPEAAQQIIEKYQDASTGTGRLPGLHKIVLREDAEPNVSAPRKIPNALEEQVKAELKRMEKKKVIVRVTKPTSYATPIVIVTKRDGSIRLCLYSREFNDNIMRSRSQIPTQETLPAKLQNATVLTLFDVSHAFHISPPPVGLRKLKVVHLCNAKRQV